MNNDLSVVRTGPAGMSNDHRSCDRYTLRIDRFVPVPVHAGSGEGELVTKPLTFSGRRLHLNYI